MKATGGYMAIGKYLSLEQARNEKKIARFTAEHPSKGDRKKFSRLLDTMIRTPESDGQTSPKKYPSED